MKRVPAGLGLLINLKELDLSRNSLELPEERALVAEYSYKGTAENVVAYFSQRLEVRAQRSLLLLCKATLFLTIQWATLAQAKHRLRRRWSFSTLSPSCCPCCSSTDKRERDLSLPTLPLS